MLMLSPQKLLQMWLHAENRKIVQVQVFEVYCRGRCPISTHRYGQRKSHHSMTRPPPPQRNSATDKAHTRWKLFLFFFCFCSQSNFHLCFSWWILFCFVCFCLAQAAFSNLLSSDIHIRRPGFAGANQEPTEKLKQREYTAHTNDITNCVRFKGTIKWNQVKNVEPEAWDSELRLTGKCGIWKWWNMVSELTKKKKRKKKRVLSSSVWANTAMYTCFFV